jgi:hypothetical protein
MKQPAAQLDAVHTSPAPQIVPSALIVQVVVPAAGAHCWQALDGLLAPDAYTAPSMKQPAPQPDALHTSPAPQLVPAESALQDAVFVPGWQL